MIVCTFYTDDFYKNFAQGLGDTVRKLWPWAGFRCEKLKSLGSHNANVHQKPLFLLETIEQWKQGVLWIDADAVVERACEPLQGLESTPVEIAHVNYKPTPKSTTELLGGTLYFSCSERAITLLRTWNRVCQLNPTELDQRLLAKVLYEDPLLAVHRLVLPVEYCWLESPMRHYYPDAEPVIRHHGVSRDALRKGV